MRGEAADGGRVNAVGPGYIGMCFAGGEAQLTRFAHRESRTAGANEATSLTDDPEILG
jgi:hypothetical protein